MRQVGRHAPAVPDDGAEATQAGRIPDTVLGPALLFGSFAAGLLALGGYRFGGGQTGYLFLLVAGAITAGVVFGLLRGWNFARGLAMVIGGLYVMYALVNFRSVAGIVFSFGIAVSLVWFLTRPDAKAWFNIRD